MSRNGSGTFSLVSGNPVVTGTTISSTTHNNTMSDIATALSDSLTKNGEAVISGDQDFNGNAVILDVDADTKIDATTDDQIDFTIGGVLELSLTAAKADNLDDLAALSHANNAILQSDGTDWEAVTVFDAAGAINEAEGSAVASATTADIWATDGNTVHVTGTTTITSLGTAPNAGAKRTVIFDGILTLTHGANLNLPGGANITTAAGDSMEVYADTTTQLDVLRYTKANGTAIARPSGSVAQLVSTVDAAVATGTTTIPSDDTIPQNTEGDQYMSLAITPTSSSSTLLIQVVANLSTSAAGSNDMIAGLFQDSTAGALAAGWTRTVATSTPARIAFNYTMTSGTTSATTFKIRAGCAAAGTTTFNGVSGTRQLGGVIASSIVITEITA